MEFGLEYGFRINVGHSALGEESGLRGSLSHDCILTTGSCCSDLVMTLLTRANTRDTRRVHGYPRCLASMGSDLEVFSHDPSDGSLTILAFQLAAFAKYLNDVLLTYKL